MSTGLSSLLFITNTVTQLRTFPVQLGDINKTLFSLMLIKFVGTYFKPVEEFDAISNTNTLTITDRLETHSRAPPSPPPTPPPTSSLSLSGKYLVGSVFEPLLLE